MNWTDLLEEVARRSDLPTSTVRTVMSNLTSVVQEKVGAGDTISLRGIGRIERRWTKGRVLRTVGTRRRMWVGGHFVPRFRPSRSLRRAADVSNEADWRAPEHQKAWRLAETLIDDLDLYHRSLAPELDDATSPEEVEEKCAEAFGSHWSQVVETFSRRTEGVNTPFLGIVARKKWGAAA